MANKRFIISAFALSDPSTMGGNSKICLEIARHLSEDFEVHIVTTNAKVLTVTNALGELDRLFIHSVEPYSKSELSHPFQSGKHYTKALNNVLEELNACENDIVYTCSDFHIDTIPCLRLKKKYRYKWIGVQFLFIPFIFENLRKGYKFPALKYLLAWFYSTTLFHLAKSKADAFVITNDSDRSHFSKEFQNKVFAFYGGVNVDQIPFSATAKTRDVVFCSRLHPQKGIDGFLDVWKIVHELNPEAKLTIIGNGEKSYERYLKSKALSLGIDDSIEWLGYVNDEPKYEIYRSSRIMVHPTVFDNNGMVAAEALCSGLPVVMYDLPALKALYTKGCVKIPFGNKKEFAKCVLRLLSDKTFYEKIIPEKEALEELRQQWSWRTRVKSFKKWMEACSL